jgi:hypothetical protein
MQVSSLDFRVQCSFSLKRHLVVKFIEKEQIAFYQLKRVSFHYYLHPEAFFGVLHSHCK